MVYKFLSSQFYSDYPHSQFPELEHKTIRPYIMICVTVNQHTFALPLRSHICHPYAYITNKVKKCGVDFSKAVYISDEKYIDNSTRPFIRTDEYRKLIGKEHIIKNKLIKYISDFVDAYKSQDENKISRFRFSTLYYFQDLIDYERDILIPLKEKEVSKV